MIAFVLSGGGSRGALQVGALQALLGRGIRPDLVVGTSAGALNAALIASNPTLDGVRRLCETWGRVTKNDVYPGNRVRMFWRFLCRCDSLYSNSNFQRFVKEHLFGSRLRRFRDIATGVRLYIVATDLVKSAQYVFGDDPDDLLFDALMATTALPPLHAPWRYRDSLYVDGAFVADLPIKIAIERGADEIFALHVTRPIEQVVQNWLAVDVTTEAIGAFLKHQTLVQLELVASLPKIRLHYVPFRIFHDVPVWDFGQAAQMIRAGRAAMEEYLSALEHPASLNPSPNYVTTLT